MRGHSRWVIKTIEEQMTTQDRNAPLIPPNRDCGWGGMGDWAHGLCAQLSLRRDLVMLAGCAPGPGPVTEHDRHQV